MLNRRIRKSATLHEPDPDIPAWVDALLDDMKRLGFINDEAFAQTRAVSLHRSGKSARAIRQTLVGKGIRGEALDRAMAAAADELGHGEDTRAMDRRAGLEFARRRRLGVFNPLSEVRAERRKRTWRRWPVAASATTSASPWSRRGTRTTCATGWIWISISDPCGAGKAQASGVVS